MIMELFADVPHFGSVAHQNLILSHRELRTVEKAQPRGTQSQHPNSLKNHIHILSVRFSLLIVSACHLNW